MYRIFIALLLNLTLLATVSQADELTALRLSPENRKALFEYLDKTPCDCGCGMTVAQCLHEDPVCKASPRMAKAALERFQALEPAPKAHPEEHHEHEHQHEHHPAIKSSAAEPVGKTGL